ncbi:MAG: DsbA family oxidoreductase [Sphingopyxis sp.]
MAKALTIDFVSDIVCPWCVVGLRSIEQALGRVAPEITATVRIHPFELNPDMDDQGQIIAQHVEQKYGMTADESAPGHREVRERAAALGFTIATTRNSRIHNSFNAHRLLHWAKGSGRQIALKHALFAAYFTDGKNPGNTDVLVDAAQMVGLDPLDARIVVASGRHAVDVRNSQRFWRHQGITAVPATILNDRYIISGGQPVEKFERAFRSIAAEM